VIFTQVPAPQIPRTEVSYIMAVINVDVRGETCPIPLVETRKAIRKAASGDIIEVTGTHPASKVEIPMAIKALNLNLLDISENGEVWTIRIQL